MRTVRRATAALGVTAACALLAACGEASEPPVARHPTGPVLEVVDATPHGRPAVLDAGHPLDDLEGQVRRDLDARTTLDVHVAAPAATASSYALGERTGTDVAEQADALARVLGLTGREVTPRTGGRRTWRDGDRTLVVGPGPGTPWAYTREGVRCSDLDVSQAAALASCAPYTADDRSPGDPRSTPVSVDAARHDAGPVLDAVGVDPEAAEVTTGWGTSLVSADPTVAGLPTSGMATSAVVDADGVLAADGWLGPVTRGPAYPVLGAEEVVALRRGQAPELRCPSPVPAGTFRSPECDRPEVVVDTATFGLMRWTVDQRPVLVPAWIYAEAAGPWRVAVPAVTREHLSPGTLPPGPVRAAGGAVPAPAR